jgi:hypothetical protein
MPHDRLSREAHSGLHESEFSVAVRFMKSMSISDQGRSRLNCVCRWSSGFWSALNPEIHIFAGEKVCIHAMTPMQFGEAFASRIRAWICSGPANTGFVTTATGISPAASR